MESIINSQLPEFKVQAFQNGEFKTVSSEDVKGKWAMFFFYPADFTFVCPTELHAFEELKGEFEKRNTIIIGASVDTCEVHFAWLNTPKDQGGIEGVSYPILADTTRNLSNALGILEADHIYNEELENYLIEGSNVTFRATFLIDENGKVFHESVNDMPLGRNVKEYLRLIDAYTHVQKFGEVCPANWEEGKEAMHADRKSTAEYLAKH